MGRQINNMFRPYGRYVEYDGHKLSPVDPEDTLKYDWATTSAVVLATCNFHVNHEKTNANVNCWDIMHGVDKIGEVQRDYTKRGAHDELTDWINEDAYKALVSEFSALPDAEKDEYSQKKASWRKTRLDGITISVQDILDFNGMNFTYLGDSSGKDDLLNHRQREIHDELQRFEKVYAKRQEKVQSKRAEAAEEILGDLQSSGVDVQRDEV